MFVSLVFSAKVRHSQAFFGSGRTVPLTYRHAAAYPSQKVARRHLTPSRMSKGLSAPAKWAAAMLPRSKVALLAPELAVEAVEGELSRHGRLAARVQSGVVRRIQNSESRNQHCRPLRPMQNCRTGRCHRVPATLHQTESETQRDGAIAAPKSAGAAPAAMPEV